MKKKVIMNETMKCGDYMRIVLHKKPPINDCDDIEIDINGLYGRHRLVIQDWEAVLLIKGLLLAVKEKHKTLRNAFDKMLKQKVFTFSKPRSLRKSKIDTQCAKKIKKLMDKETKRIRSINLC